MRGAISGMLGKWIMRCADSLQDTHGRRGSLLPCLSARNGNGLYWRPMVAGQRAFRRREFRELIGRYQPCACEVSTDERLHYPGTHWLQIQAYRYFRAVNFVRGLGGLRGLLDVGCFPGTMLRVIGSLWPSAVLHGVGLGVTEDLRAAMTGAVLHEVNIDPDVFFAGYNSIPTVFGMGDQSIQIVTVMEVLEHLYNPVHVLREVYRVLEPGGWCYVTTNNVASLPGIARIVAGDTPMDGELCYSTALFDGKTDWRGHVRFWSRRELREMLQGVGFSSVRVSTFTTETWYPNRTTTVAKMLVQRVLNALRSRYGTHLEGTAQKAGSVRANSPGKQGD